jgi:hypothetical protein
MKDINYFWKEHPIIQRLLGFKPGTSERLEDLQGMEKQEIRDTPLNFNCLCKSCGEIVKDEHTEDEPHVMTLCGQCV